MDINTDSHRVHRLQVVQTGRRHRWTTAEKIRIVEESFAGHRQASATARRHDVPVSQLFGWRKAYAEGRLTNEEMPPVPFFEAVVVADEPEVATATSRCQCADGGRMEIVVSNGRRVIVGAGVDADALARVITVLEEA